MMPKGKLQAIGTFEDSISFESDAEPYLPIKPSVDDDTTVEEAN